MNWAEFGEEIHVQLKRVGHGEPPILELPATAQAWQRFFATHRTLIDEHCLEFSLTATWRPLTDQQRWLIAERLGWAWSLSTLMQTATTLTREHTIPPALRWRWLLVDSWNPFGERTRSLGAAIALLPKGSVSEALQLWPPEFPDFWWH